ncbi:MAG: cation diffusion facilitator family transporter [Deltaproteobacteria bacterium]|nr:cation diffusion facilitator family transporter [Deltaproteobacteria bacterium]
MEDIAKIKPGKLNLHASVEHAGYNHPSADYAHSHSLNLNAESFRSERNLKIAFFLTIFILITEFSGALISKSMALYSDSGHILVDASSLLLAWFAQMQVRKTPTEKNTYGYHRMGILAALFNSSLLLVISLILIYESYFRLVHPEIINSEIMIIFPLISLVVNIIIGMRIHKDIHSNLNLKSSFFHILGDSLISISIIAAGIIIYFTKFYYIDPIISLIVSPIIAIGAFSVINETINILLEGVPKEIDFAMVKDEILKTRGVKNVHDLHIWSMSKSFRLLSAHILVEKSVVKSSDICCIINNIQGTLEKKFNINHVVIQPEFDACDMTNSFCVHQNP